MSVLPLVTLYRPVGEAELQLVEASNWRRFPPRLPEQPIFYPVCNQRYADEIASRWNTAGGARGHVLAFDVPASLLEGYERQVVGARYHEEYWIPAEELDAFNEAICGPIRKVATFEPRHGAAQR